MQPADEERKSIDTVQRTQHGVTMAGEAQKDLQRNQSEGNATDRIGMYRAIRAVQFVPDKAEKAEIATLKRFQVGNSAIVDPFDETE